MATQGAHQRGPGTNTKRSKVSQLRWLSHVSTCKRTNNANNATHHVNLGKKRQESSTRNNCMIWLRVTIKEIIIIVLNSAWDRDVLPRNCHGCRGFSAFLSCFLSWVANNILVPISRHEKQLQNGAWPPRNTNVQEPQSWILIIQRGHRPWYLDDYKYMTLRFHSEDCSVRDSLSDRV